MNDFICPNCEMEFTPAEVQDIADGLHWDLYECLCPHCALDILVETI